MTELHILAEDTLTETPKPNGREGIESTLHMTVAHSMQDALRGDIENVARSYGINVRDAFVLGPTFVLRVQTGSYHALQQLMAVTKRHGEIDGLDFHNEPVEETLEEAA